MFSVKDMTSKNNRPVSLCATGLHYSAERSLVPFQNRPSSIQLKVSQFHLFLPLMSSRFLKKKKKTGFQ